jgi:hypothetical protein
MAKKVMKSVKVSVESVERADELKMSVNQYLSHLIYLSDIGRREFENNQLRRLEKVEGILGSLVDRIYQKDIAERSLVLKLEKDLKQVMMNNDILHDLILAKFEFINALEKELSK